MERSRYTISKEDATPAKHIEPRRGCPPHRLVPDPFSSHCADDALCHGDATRRVGSLASLRYRQPTHGHPHPGRERSRGPRCHAQSHAAGSLARVLAWAEAQTRRLVIPGRERAHQPSSHHSQNRLLRLLSGCAAGWPPESGSSAHATSLSTLPDYVL